MTEMTKPVEIRRPTGIPGQTFLFKGSSLAGQTSLSRGRVAWAWEGEVGEEMSASHWGLVGSNGYKLSKRTAVSHHWMPSLWRIMQLGSGTLGVSSLL